MISPLTALSKTKDDQYEGREGRGSSSVDMRIFPGSRDKPLLGQGASQQLSRFEPGLRGERRGKGRPRTAAELGGVR